MSTDASRAALGCVYRITADFLEKRGLMEKVKTQLSPPSRKVLDKLPFAFAWQDYSPLEEIERVLHQYSPQLADDLGYAAAEYLSGTVVAPVLKMAFSLFGRTPAALFGNLDRFYSMVVRGFSFRFGARATGAAPWSRASRGPACTSRSSGRSAATCA